MRQHALLRILILIGAVIGIVCVSSTASAAGVGIINVPPNYQFAELSANSSSMTIYLGISDYNSWQDIYYSKIEFKNKGALVAVFMFQQYDDREMTTRINNFSQPMGNTLLTEQSNVVHSDQTLTVDDRCLLNVTFTFKPFRFTDVLITTEDLAGLTTTIAIDYALGGGGTLRQENVLVIPFLNKQIEIEQISLESLVVAAAASTSIVFVQTKFR